MAKALSNEFREENNYPKAFLATGLIMAVLIGLCYFIVFKSPPPEENGTGGILVNYGTVDEGMGNDYMSTEEPSVAEKANQTKPDKVTPTPPSEEQSPVDNTENKVVTQESEDAPEVKTTDKKPSTTVTAAQPTKTPPKQATVNQNALYKGPTNNGTGQGDGTGNKPGNQGKPEGSTLTNNYDGTGSGNGGSLKLAQRNFTSRPQVSDDGHHEGTVVIDIQVDKSGSIVYALPGRGTTIVDNALIEKCIKAVKRARVNASENAADTQPGQVVFKFKAQ